MPEAGQRIGEYVLDARIGQGPFGEVWRAHHSAWQDQLAAVKFPSNPQVVRNFQQQGAALYKLNHPNIARPIGFDPTGSPPYVMTEFAPGASLRQLLTTGKPTVARAVSI